MGALSELVNVYTYGAKKYADHNWRKGLKYTDCFRAILSHTMKWFLGEQRDPESGCHHLAHAAWNCLTLVEFDLLPSSLVTFDDRHFPMAQLQGTENIKEPPPREMKV